MLFGNMDSGQQQKLIEELMQKAKKKPSIAESKSFKPKMSRKQKVLEMALLINRGF